MKLCDIKHIKVIVDHIPRGNSNLKAHISSASIHLILLIVVYISQLERILKSDY
jgi:hypothetical protein